MYQGQLPTVAEAQAMQGRGWEDGYGLNPRQFRFISHLAEYGVLWAAWEHAYGAGDASQSTLGGYASKALARSEKLRRALTLEMARRRQLMAACSEAAISHLVSMATVDPLDIFDSDGEMKPLHMMPAAARRLIQSIEHTQYFDRDGEHVRTKKAVKLPDKGRATEMLLKHLGLFEKDHEQGAAAAGSVLAQVLGRGAPAAGSTVDGEFAVVGEMEAEEAETGDLEARGRAPRESSEGPQALDSAPSVTNRNIEGSGSNETAGHMGQNPKYHENQALTPRRVPGSGSEVAESDPVAWGWGKAWDAGQEEEDEEGDASP